MTNTLEEAKHWLAQRTPAADKLQNFLATCIDLGLEPKTVQISQDLYVELCTSAAKVLGMRYDPENPPCSLRMQIGEREVVVYPGEKMPPRSIRAHHSE